MYLCCGWLCRDFCFEGSCELCQFEVEAGAQELGSKAQPGMLQLRNRGRGDWGMDIATCAEPQSVILQASKSWFVGVLLSSQADRVVLCM